MKRLKTRAVQGKPGSGLRNFQLTEVELPDLGTAYGGYGVLTGGGANGLCGTDKHIVESNHGSGERLIPGHEFAKVVIDVGPNVTHVKPGDVVVVAVREMGSSPESQAGMRCYATEPLREKGIFEDVGGCAEHAVYHERDLFLSPENLRDGWLCALSEPQTISLNGLREAANHQRRLGVPWQPRKALVLGSGAVGVLAVPAIKRRYPDCEVVLAARSEPSESNIGGVVAQRLGARYLSLSSIVGDLLEEIAEAEKIIATIRGDDEASAYRRGGEEGVLALRYERLIGAIGNAVGDFDYVFDASTSPGLAIASNRLLRKNGVLSLTTIPERGSRRLLPYTEGDFWDQVIQTRTICGNVNAADEDWREGIATLEWVFGRDPGVLKQAISHRVYGLDRYHEAMKLFMTGRDEKGIKPLKLMLHIGAE